jgi:hypothetical protein
MIPRRIRRRTLEESLPHAQATRSQVKGVVATPRAMNGHGLQLSLIQAAPAEEPPASSLPDTP